MAEDGNRYGKLLLVTTSGTSHGPEMKTVVEGCPAGVRISVDDIQRDLDRRRPGQKLTSQRNEPDTVEIREGIKNNLTTGEPIAMVVKNTDIRSEDYKTNIPRPGHADMSLLLKEGGIEAGGGRSSGRETVGRVCAGAVAKKILEQEGIEVTGRIVELGDVEKAKEEGNSLGGIVEVIATGVPPGLGEPVFDKLDADLAKAVMSVGSVKAVEIGAGMKVARMKGSENNDEIVVEDGKLRTKTNNAGGILGGISNGMPIVVRVAVKPTPSISKPQGSVDLDKMEETVLEIRGRHDPCICLRIVPVLEAMVALVLADHLLRTKKSLAGLRLKIDAIDRQIVELVGERMRIVREIGRLKKGSGKQVEDKESEARVLQSIQKKSGSLGVDSDLVESIFKDIIRNSKRVQEELK